MKQAGVPWRGRWLPRRWCWQPIIVMPKSVTPKNFPRPEGNRSAGSYGRTRSHGRSVQRAAEIDNQNIHRATLVAMRRAVLGLPCTPDFVIVDGRFYPELPYPGSACVRADETESAVSAASILAKVFRDRYMAFLDRKYPEYGFCQHKGYATAMHLEVLQSYGPCPDHRRSFRPVASAIQTCPVPKPGEREQH